MIFDKLIYIYIYIYNNYWRDIKVDKESIKIGEKQGLLANKDAGENRNTNKKESLPKIRIKDRSGVRIKGLIEKHR